MLEMTFEQIPSPNRKFFKAFVRIWFILNFDPATTYMLIAYAFIEWNASSWADQV